MTIPDLLPRESFQASLHKNITWADIATYPNLPWNFYGLSLNPNIDVKTIMSYLHLPWEFFYVCNRKEFLEPLDDSEERLYIYLLEWDCDCDF